MQDRAATRRRSDLQNLQQLRTSSDPPKIVRRDYHGQVEEFAVFCPELGAVYLTPIEDLPNKAMATLRVRPSRNRQRARIRMAAQYELPRIDVY
jgi:hypothetical protein